MTKEFVTYKKFDNEDRAAAIAGVLNDSGIELEIAKDRDSLDSLYGGQSASPQFYIKIQQRDFEQADLILAKVSQEQLTSVDTDHYLYAFSDEELFEVVCKPDEWNEFDYELAKKILAERGKSITPAIIDLLKQRRVNDLTKPEEIHKGWIFAGYLLALLGGLFGIFIGWQLYNFRKTLPNGERVYAYNIANRRHGLRILVIGIITFIITTAARIAVSEY